MDRNITAAKSTGLAVTVFAIIIIWAICSGNSASAQTKAPVPQTKTYVKDTVSYHQCGAITQKGTPCKIMVKNGTKYCYHHDQPKVNLAEGKTIYEGPKGGHYYLKEAADGTVKKVYIKTK